MENHQQEIDNRPETKIDFSGSIGRLNEILKHELSEQHYRVYMMLFFEDSTEEEVAQFMGFKSNEKNRTAGYKQIKNIKKMLKEKVQDVISKNDIIL
jgi:hypothetical protein